MFSHVYVDDLDRVAVDRGDLSPPVEKRHSRHILMANSLYWRMSSMRRFMRRSLSEKPASTCSPLGWKEIECTSSVNVFEMSDDLSR